MSIPKTELAVATSSTGKSSDIDAVERINVTLQSTHSSISYFPRVSCIRKFIWFCGRKFEPWVLNEYYLGVGNQRHSFRSIRKGHRGAIEDGAREIHFTVRAQAVHIWGAPRERLYPFGLAQQEICIGESLCQKIDIQNAYSNVSDNKPALIWSMRHLDPSQTHSFILRVVEPKGDDDRIMSLHEIVYESVARPKQHYGVPKQAISVNQTIENTDDRIQYTAKTSCIRYWFFFTKCATRWKTSVFDVLAEDIAGRNRRVAQESFSRVQTRSSVSDIPQASFRFRGSAVYVYGAPPSQITLPHAAQQICLNGVCEFLDVHEAYLNPHIAAHLRDASSEHLVTTNVSFDTNSVLSPEPGERSVLLWYARDLKWDEQHHVSLRMIEVNPPVGAQVRGMTIDYVAYTSVQLPSRPSPAPEASTLFITIIVLVLAGFGSFLALRWLCRYIAFRPGNRPHKSPTSSHGSSRRQDVQNHGAAQTSRNTPTQMHTPSPISERSCLLSSNQRHHQPDMHRANEGCISPPPYVALRAEDPSAARIADYGAARTPHHSLAGQQGRSER